MKKRQRFGNITKEAESSTDIDTGIYTQIQIERVSE